MGSAGSLQINVIITMKAAGNARAAGNTTDDVCARLPHNLGVKAKYRSAKLESGIMLSA